MLGSHEVGSSLMDCGSSGFLRFGRVPALSNVALNARPANEDPDRPSRGKTSSAFPAIIDSGNSLGVASIAIELPTKVGPLGSHGGIGRVRH